MAESKLTTKGVEKLIREKAVGKHYDGGGLFLQITDAGGAYWRYKYRLGGKEKLFAIGTIENVSLSEAREKHREARKLVTSGDDPVSARQEDRTAKEVARIAYTPFREIATQWKTTMIPATTSYSTLRRHGKCLEHLNAGFGSKAVTAVTVADLATVLKKVQASGSLSMRVRVQHLAVKIMAFAVGHGYVKHNDFLNVSFDDSFISPDTVYEARPALTDALPFGKLLRRIDSDPDIDALSRTGLRILALIAVRPGELVKALWDHIDWIDAKMVVPFEVQKQRTERRLKKDPRVGKAFEVPLSRQAIVELRKLQKLTGGHTHLFPAYSVKRHKNPHMRAAQFNNMLIKMGYQGEHCAHGFRSTFSTIMNAERVQVGDRKVLRWPYQDAIIEVQLDHNDTSTKKVYDRGGQWEDRCEVMQAWADHIDAMREARSNVLKFERDAA